MIKIYVVYDKELNYFISDNEYIHKFKVDIDYGINIAHKNNYCELRAHYWVWKNEIEKFSYNDMVGFFHYRRYINLDVSKILDSKNMKNIVPYTIVEKPDIEKYCSKYNIDKISEFDIIGPVAEKTGVKVIDRYSLSKGHRKKDLILLRNIILEKHPQYIFYFDKYMNSKSEYYANMFIMKKNIFNNYCNWLFDILKEFDSRCIDIQANTDGYIAERLFGVYITYLQYEKKLNIAYLPREHFYIYDDVKHKFKYKKVINIFIKPGGILRRILNIINYKIKDYKEHIWIF